jgi:predicted ribosomally synthesized peptide with SipW-like signal peptide
MKKLLFIAMSCILAIGLVGGAFAYFADTETSTGNTFTAGSLDVDVSVSNSICSDAGKVTIYEQANGLNDCVVFSNLAPGDSGKIIWTFHNIGSLNGLLDADYQGINDWDGLNTDPEYAVEGTGITATTAGELNDLMTLSTRYLLDGVPQAYTWTGYMSTCTPSWHVADSFPKPLPAGSTYTMEWSWSIPTTVGNIIQGDTFTLNVRLSLNQIP